MPERNRMLVVTSVGVRLHYPPCDHRNRVIASRNRQFRELRGFVCYPDYEVRDFCSSYSSGQEKRPLRVLIKSFVNSHQVGTSTNVV